MTNTYTPKTKLVSINVSGNLHDVARYVTKFGLSDFFVLAEGAGGHSSVVLLRLPADWPTDDYGPLPATGATAKEQDQ